MTALHVRDPRPLTWQPGTRLVHEDGLSWGYLGAVDFHLAVIQVRIIGTHGVLMYKIDSRKMVEVRLDDPRSVALWLDAKIGEGVPF